MPGIQEFAQLIDDSLKPLMVKIQYLETELKRTQALLNPQHELEVKPDEPLSRKKHTVSQDLDSGKYLRTDGKEAAYFDEALSTEVINDVTGFNHNLSSADTTVQKALDTIDNLTIGTGTVTGTGTTNKLAKWTAASAIGDATNTDAEVSAAVTASHAKQHSITATADHTSTATSGQMLKADVNGLPVDATNTDAQVSAAISASHAAATVLDTTAINLTLAGQQVSADFGTDASTVLPMSQLGTPTYKYLSDWFNTVQSSGRISGLTITAHAPADGTVDISAGEFVIKTTNAVNAVTKFATFAGQSSLALTDNDLNYLYMSYNAGTPVVVATTDRTTIHEYDHFTIGRVYRKGTDSSDIVNSGTNIYNAHRRLHNKEVKKYGFDHALGAVVSEAGTRGLSTTEGTWYIGLTEIITPAKSTGSGDTFSTYYRSATPGVWTLTTGVTQLSNTQYDDGTGTLATLTATRYAVHWIYICPEGDIYSVYGQGDYKLAQAQEALAPSSLPDYLSSNARLAAKVIILKSATNFYEIESAWITMFMAGNPVNHNDLNGLQGGTTDQYYHITASSILDANGNERITFTDTASAVNFLKLTNAATLNPVRIDADGSDSNVGLNIYTKGAGNLSLFAGLLGLTVDQGLTKVNISGADIDVAGSGKIYKCEGTSGVTGTITFPDNDGVSRTITVKGGIVTALS